MTEDFKKGLATGLAIGGIQDGGSSGGGIQIVDIQFDLIMIEIQCVSYEIIE